ncbi:Wilms tumor protein 1-interacting protein homolog [Mobula birostris]|uniref:Wilms tumor protein 1-interacting protein homolog n=1 Tax=Mobula birostris TaxID=1983395 RepID=UPI003B28D5CD
MSKYEEDVAVQATFLQDLSLYEAPNDGLYGARRELLGSPSLEETKRAFLLQMIPGHQHHVLEAASRMNGSATDPHLQDRGLGTSCKLSTAPRGANGNRCGPEPQLAGEPDPVSCYFKGHGAPAAFGYNNADSRRYSGGGGGLVYEPGQACGRQGGYAAYPPACAPAGRGNNVSTARSNNVSAGRCNNVSAPGQPPDARLGATSPRSSLASSSSSNSTQEHGKHPSPRSSLYPSPRSSLVVGGTAQDKYSSPRASLIQYEGGGGLSSRSSYASTASDTSKHSSPRASLNEGGGGGSRPSSNRTSGISMGYDQRHVSPRSSYSDSRFAQADAEGGGPGQGPSARSSISSQSSRGSLSAAYGDLQLPSSPRSSLLSAGLPEESYPGLESQPACAGDPCCQQRAPTEAAAVTLHPYGYSPGKGPPAAHKVRLPYQVTPGRDSGPSQAEKRLEALTRELEKELELHVKKEYFGICVKCRKGVYGSSQACQAMGNLYHTNCFICCSCGRRLRGKAFYNVNGKVYCEEDFLYSGFQQTADKCFVCGHLIMEMILQALGKSYHPGCFRCVVCNECLDGVPFTVDVENNIYCVKDYHTVFAPKCASCGHPILPAQGSEETIRVVSMDKDYHVECYHCEDCGLQLNDEETRRCYPLEGHLLCHSCHIRRINVPLPAHSAPNYQLHVTEL